MIKRIISLILCVGMLTGVLLMAGCGEEKPNTEQTTLPATINMLGITGPETTPEAIQAVEDAINKITKNRYKTKVNLTLVTADAYIELIESRVALAEHTKTTLAAINKYNTLAIKDANQATKLLAAQNKRTSKWTKEVRVEASTLSTGETVSVEETIVLEDGRIETKYPDPASPIDIIMIADKDMYTYLDEKGYLQSIQRAVIAGDSGSAEFPKFKQYIYPTYFSQLAAITGDVKAIPNNNLLAEYTYLLVDKALADQYDFDIDTVSGYADLDAAAEGEEGFLASIKKNETIAPMASEPDALGVYYYFDNGIAIGTYLHPIYGYNEQEGTDFKVQNLFSIPQYQAHVALMEQYRGKGYFAASESAPAAVKVIRGDASVPAEYGDSYYVKVIQNPFVEADKIFDGMMAVSSFTSDEKRALRILELFNTDPEAKNLLQYGIALDGSNDDVANYRVNTETDENGTVSYSIQRLNHSYMMDNSLTGNVYMGYPEEGQRIDAWTYYKQTNLASSLSPFLTFYTKPAAFDDMLTSILRRAVMSEALAPIGVDYDAYEKAEGTSSGRDMRHNFKLQHKVYFIDALVKDGVSMQNLNLITGKTTSALAKDYLTFLLSAEGQAILTQEGYTAVATNAPHYVAKAGSSGTIKLGAMLTSMPVGYFDTTMTALAEAYMKLNPGVTVEVPVKDSNNAHLTDMNKVLNGTYDLGFLNAELTNNQKNLGLSSTLVAKSALHIFNDDSNRVYNFLWYENKMIADVSAERYSKIVSKTGLDLLVSNKLGELAGIDLSKYSEKTRPASETVAFNQAKTQADSYYNNIAYLRIMTEMLLFDGLSENELAVYRAMNEQDFADAVFNYVRENYEKENNLSDDDYTKLVRNFMVSVLEYTNPNDKTSTYTVSWDDFQKVKADAQLYIEAASKVRDAYYDKLMKKLGAISFRLLTFPEIMDEVYGILYEEYLAENGLAKAEFEAAIKDRYLTAVGTTAEEFATFAKSSDEYKNYLSKLRKKFKNILVNEFSAEAYKRGDVGITNAEVLSTLFDYYLEKELQLNDKLCELAGVDYDELIESKADLENYTMYLNTMRTMFVYTLRTKYTQAQIDAWSYEEIEANLYSILHETGFYTNEMAKYIGQTLSEYMQAKSKAVTYQGYVEKAVNALSAELKANGYDPATLIREDRETIEKACKAIIATKYFSDRVNMQDVLKEASKPYIDGFAAAADKAAYTSEAAEGLRQDYFFTAVVGALEASWQETKSALAAEKK